ncbi:MAG: antibiotic biosynthesis monooxygenase [Deltaproteobacteria bacterium]|nr:antibiotic biosynthesis monooxygenase [Deltaproteobacteria bacterium]
MYVTIVTVHVKPERVEEFIEATRPNHEGAVREPGNIRFDVLRSPDDPARFLLYEAYEDAAGAARHKETPHYLAWRETVKDWMATPRQGVTCEVVFPS